MDWLVHDLLQVSEVSDLVYIGWELLPASPTPISTISENGQHRTYGDSRRKENL